MWLKLVLAAVLGALLAGAGPEPAAARKPRPPVCPGGRFVSPSLLLPDGLAGLPDAIEIAGGKILVASGCPPVDVVLRGSRRGDKLKLSWPSCRGLAKKVKLSARIDPSCRTLKGKIRSKGWKRSFVAPLEPVRACDYVPGVSVPATMPPEVVSPPPDPPPDPLPPPPGPTSVAAATTAAQLGVFDALWQAVHDLYVDPGFGGLDWFELQSRYRALIEQGLSDDDFHEAMKLVVRELGDDHSNFQSPGEVEEEERALAEGARVVGIGVLVQPWPDLHTGSVLTVYPHGPAAQAGLRPHDMLLAVDGLPLIDEDGNYRIRGDEGTTFSLTFQRPGEKETRTIDLVRRRIQDFTPIDACVVPDTRIGYVFVPTFADPLVDDRIRLALFRMTLDGPLEGLVLDQRQNGGGSSTVALPTLALFGSGLQGTLVARDGFVEYSVAADDVGGSQSVPLVVLADRDTVSFGEIATGVLQNADRAVVVGGPTAGNVELLSNVDLADGSRAWIATYTFEPVGLPAGIWEGIGVTPDEEVRTRWDLFSGETDPALARAVELLQQGLAPVPTPAARRAEPGTGPAGPTLETRSEALPGTR